jgi:hypothetical protein
MKSRGSLFSVCALVLIAGTSFAPRHDLDPSRAVASSAQQNEIVQTATLSSTLDVSKRDEVKSVEAHASESKVDDERSNATSKQ